MITHWSTPLSEIRAPTLDRPSMVPHSSAVCPPLHLLPPAPLTDRRSRSHHGSGFPSRRLAPGDLLFTRDDVWHRTQDLSQDRLALKIDVLRFPREED